MPKRNKTRLLVLAAVMAAVLAVLSPLAIPLGPVPITLGTLAVFLTGALLPPLSAAAALSVYILIGLLGLPVFSGFRAGPGVLVGPTGGYLLGYYFIVLALAFARRRTQKPAWQLAAAMGGMAACYLVGTLWYTVVSGASFASGLAVCVLPFVLPDFIKAVAALALARQLEKLLGKRGLTL